jgi:hypothetical protein
MFLLGFYENYYLYMLLVWLSRLPCVNFNEVQTCVGNFFVSFFFGPPMSIFLIAYDWSKQVNLSLHFLFAN